VAERPKIARIAARPAAGACCQVDIGEPAVDRLLIGEIGGECDPALDRYGAATLDTSASLIGIVDRALEFEDKLTA
jgi:hypothetical protein